MTAEILLGISFCRSDEDKKPLNEKSNCGKKCYKQTLWLIIEIFISTYFEFAMFEDFEKYRLKITLHLYNVHILFIVIPN